MESNISKLISSIPNLTEAEKKEIEQSINIKEFKKGTYLLKEGQVAKHCYFVFQGHVRQFIIKNGEEKTTAFYTEGEPVNSFTSYSEKEPASHYLICGEDCLLSLGNPEDEKNMYAKIPALESYIHKEVSMITGDIQEQLSNFMTSTPEERYLYLVDNKPHLLQKVALQQIASYIGVTPESLSRIRNRIAKKKSS